MCISISKQVDKRPKMKILRLIPDNMQKKNPLKCIRRVTYVNILIYTCSTFDLFNMFSNIYPLWQKKHRLHFNLNMLKKFNLQLICKYVMIKSTNEGGCGRLVY